MVEGLISLAILCVVVGIICWLVLMVLAAIPLPAPFGPLARALVIVVAVLIVLFKAMAIFGVSI
jgi:hypothetical protein